MSIEDTIKANTAALAELTAALVATANLAPGAGAADTKSTTAGKTTTTKATATKATRDEMTAMLQKLGEEKNADIAKGIIKEVGGVDKMAKIPDGKVDAVYKAAKAKLEEADEGEGDEGGL